jgi:methyl-accepting chemotaxis protein
MEPYEPSSGAPAAFISTPIFDGSKKIGVLVFQINISQINQVMMEKSGLNETGETYIIGSDYLMRSNSRFSQNGESPVLKSKVESEAAKGALAGNADAKFVNDYRGVSVLSVYSPAEIKSLDWAIMAGMDKEEILRPVIKLRNWIILTCFILMAIVCVTGFFKGATITDPIQKIIMNLTESGEQIASASSQISSSSQSLAEGASEQAASIEETSASLEKISSMTKQNAENAQQADNLMKDANRVVGEANTSMTELTGSMEEMTKAS